MNRHVLAAAAAMTFAFGGAASAATIVMNPSAKYDYKIHNTNDDDGQSLLLDTVTGNGDDAADLVVRYTAGANQSLAQAGHGQGYAWVGAADGSSFNEITITPESGFLGFTAFAFNFEFDNQQYGPAYGIQIDLTFSDGSVQAFDLDDAHDMGWGQPAKFDIALESGDPAYITKIFVHDFFAHETGGRPADRDQLGPALPFGAIKQASFNGAFAPPAGVPEPEAWALMIIGFCGAGAMLRRRRMQVA